MMEVDRSPATMQEVNALNANEKEHGRVFVVTRDGSLGPCCPIIGETIIGRAKDSDIRIKINAVSKRQARIAVDENGACFIENLSGTNPTLVNNASIANIGDVYLKNDDVITIGDRSFVFQSGDPTETTRSANEKLKVKTVENLESIDDAMTTNFSQTQLGVLQETNVFLDTIQEGPEEELSAEVKKKKKTPSKSPGKSADVSGRPALSFLDQIKARRKSYCTEEVAPNLLSSPVMRVPTPRKTMRTPLREAINARRKSISATPKSTAPKSAEKTPSSTLPRRKSVGVSLFRQSLSGSSNKARREDEPQSSASEKDTTLAQHRPIQSSLLRQIEARRKSYSSTSPKMAKTVCTAVTEVIISSSETPVKSKTPRKSTSGIPTPKSSTKSIKKGSSMKKQKTPHNDVELSVEDDMEVVVSEKVDTPKRVSLLEEEVILANCTQLSVDALAAKLESEGSMEPTTAYSTAVDSFLQSPPTFIPQEKVVNAITTPSRQQDLIKTLEEAGARSSVTKKTPITDVVAALLQPEMEMIDAYASKIQKSSDGCLDESESYAIAMDSFIRGSERAAGGSVLPFPKDDTSGFFGASLTALFRENDDGDSADQEMVSAYAMELQVAACIDIAVAFGIALDTFLADPELFR